jgi:opacity protein-like surface antigen
MKKLIVLALFLFSMNSAFSQAEFGITGGYLNVKADGADEGLSGFYGGVYTELEFTSSFKLQPALLYGNVEDSNLLYLPVMLKYYVGGSDLNIQAGPQATYLFNENDDDNVEFKDQLGLDFGVGVGYDLFHNVFIEARYGFKIAQNSETFASADFNTLMIGLGIGI